MRERIRDKSRLEYIGQANANHSLVFLCLTDIFIVSNYSVISFVPFFL